MEAQKKLVIKYRDTKRKWIRFGSIRFKSYLNSTCIEM